ncbi:hypothetical protein G3M48_002304 [Beauveria asiatica]|uniref:Methyltransferase type 11 domain-containing protein n=1 Tax=Beauveria asiatica TaxID=1069075 RepID=A0AAW0RXM7_9HYPO
MQSKPELQRATFTKVFSNAAMHWILRPAAARQPFFAAVHAALAPGGVFAFEMGGLGNVKEMAAALLVACARRAPGGLPAVVDRHYPWFFPDEAWATAALEGAGFRVNRVEREWRPTRADKGGVEGWIRLFGSVILESVPEGEKREEAVREAAEALRVVCDDGEEGEMISYAACGDIGSPLRLSVLITSSHPFMRGPDENHAGTRSTDWIVCSPGAPAARRRGAADAQAHHFGREADNA